MNYKQISRTDIETNILKYLKVILIFKLIDTYYNLITLGLINVMKIRTLRSACKHFIYETLMVYIQDYDSPVTPGSPTNFVCSYTNGLKSVDINCRLPPYDIIKFTGIIVFLRWLIDHFVCFQFTHI